MPSCPMDSRASPESIGTFLSFHSPPAYAACSAQISSKNILITPLNSSCGLPISTSRKVIPANIIAVAVESAVSEAPSFSASKIFEEQEKKGGQGNLDSYYGYIYQA